MTYDISALRATEADFLRIPSIVSYSRLEPVDLSSGDLGPGLEVRIADPLWMVGRQWQFEELRGEDGGAPILAEVTGERAPVSRFHAGALAASADPAAAAVDVPGDSMPLEVAIEAEVPAVLPERIRVEQGLQLLRLLRGSGLPPPVVTRLVAALLAQWPIAGQTDPVADPASASRRRVAAGRVPDGSAVAAALASRRGADGSVRTLPANLDAAAGTNPRRARLRELLTTWVRWVDGYLAAPVGGSWDPHRLEYSFALQASLPSGDVVLRADEYAGGTLDWHAVDAVGGPALGAAPPLATEVHERSLPTPVRYPGMPSDRLWAFEDAQVHLGGLKAGLTDLARLALVEFGLVFGTDWFLVPVRLRYGDVARIDSTTVTDTFGETVVLQPSRDVSRPGWTVFQNTPVTDASPNADVFYLPATVRHALEGEPLEEVALFRDEMANMVWGVERIVQGPGGEPVRRGLLESRAVRRVDPEDLDDARVVYRLMTPVPDHWVPFVSVPVPAQGNLARFATELERRPLVHFDDEDPTITTADVVHPRGVLLRADPTGDVATDRLRIAEEEVPRDGVVVTRRLQLARTAGGGSVLWIGRRKQPGQGEGSSGLTFDLASPPSSSRS